MSEENMKVSYNKTVDELVTVDEETRKLVENILKDIKFSYDINKKQFTSTIEHKFFGNCSIMTGKCIWLYGNHSIAAPYYVIGHMYYLINRNAVSGEKYLRIFLQNYAERNRLWIDKVNKDKTFEEVNKILMAIGIYYRFAEDMCNIEMVYFQSDATIDSILISPFHLDRFKDPEVFALLKTLAYTNIKCCDDSHKQELNNLHSIQIVKTVVNFINKLYLDKKEEE